MMVTFVSQCEKKALSRTRRVLDAFANRIGDNTWQTIITEDGLIAVKQLLRKTVTKNTAVSCHWIRSRSRSELVWIVGNRNKFNKEGVVPVNSTSKELFMDVFNVKPKAGVLYANTHYQPLTRHLFAVGYVAQQLCLQLLSNNEDKEKFAFSAFVAGCLHDLGKIDPQFQAWVTQDKSKTFVAEDGQHIDDTKFSFDKHPRHNEISYFAFKAFEQQLTGKTPINPHQKSYIEHVIYWHHAKPFRKNDKNTKNFDTLNGIHEVFDSSLTANKMQDFFETTFTILEGVDALSVEYEPTQKSIIKGLGWTKPAKNFVDELFIAQNTGLPSFKLYSTNDQSFEKFSQKTRDNANYNLIRSCVITADRLVSKLSAYDLKKYITNQNITEITQEVFAVESTLSSHIEQCLNNFPKSERTQKQHEVATELGQSNLISVLAGAAGCGKTKIALEWAKLKNAQQIIWVCPRVQVCQGIFDELTQRYLPNATIEIATGEFKYTNSWEQKTKDDDYFSGDIIITTIDQILGAIISHSKIDTLLQFMNVHVVFDEYHEYINEPAFTLLFAELIACKRLKNNTANTLLVSATPHYFYLKELLGIDIEDVIEMPSFNESFYKINFCDQRTQDDDNPLYKTQDTKTFVISNTAQTAQRSFIKNQAQENSILLHSKFKKSDKKDLFEKVYESFKQQGTDQYQILRSGPIVQASLNISCDYMVTEMTTAENILQRLGRLDRFGMNKDGVNVLTIAITESVKKGKCVDSSARFLNSLNTLQSSKAWYDLLTSELDDKPIQLSRIYALYKKFYESTQGQQAVASDLLKALLSGAALLLSKVSEPMTLPPKKQQTVGRTKISKNSLRGDNRFVQMAVVRCNNPSQPVVLNHYAYDFAMSDNEQFDNLTESLDTIRNYGLIDYMAQKHARIDKASIIEGIPATKMNMRKILLENFARDPEYPIYLSYTPDVLLHQLGEKTAHTEAIYYAVCDKQPIGAIAMKHLLNNSEE